MANVNTLLDKHVTLELESVDRLYLNGYIPTLQTPGQLLHFLVRHRGNPLASPALLGQLTRAWVAAVERFAAERSAASSTAAARSPSTPTTSTSTTATSAPHSSRSPPTARSPSASG